MFSSNSVYDLRARSLSKKFELQIIKHLVIGLLGINLEVDFACLVTGLLDTNLEVDFA